MREPQEVVLVVLVILVALVILVLLAILVMHLQVYLRRGPEVEGVIQEELVRQVLGEAGEAVHVSVCHGISALAFRARVNR
jgi:hypothetical protein